MKPMTIDRFSLHLLERSFTRERAARLIRLAHGTGPWATLAGQILSDALDGGITEEVDGVVGASARLDERSFWASTFIAIRDLGDAMPESTRMTMKGKDAGSVFGVEGLLGRRIIDTGVSDAETWWAKVEADDVSLPDQGLVQLTSEMIGMIPKISRNILDNATSSIGRFTLTGLLILITTAGLLFAVLSTDQPEWIRILVAMTGPVLIFRHCDGRDWDAQKRVENRSRTLSSLA
tara:strand:- start:241 stop:945 length:705 start_codon:yes stop_codon:yes gene_type:complete